MSSPKANSRKEAFEFLRDHQAAVLSTASDDGQPWGSAIYYLVDEDFNFYFVTRAGTFKYKNVAKNPFIALTIVDADTQTTVQVAGKVHQVPQNEYLHVFFNKFKELEHSGKHSWIPPIDKIKDGGDYMPLHLVPTRLQYANYGKNKYDVHANFIEQIIP